MANVFVTLPAPAGNGSGAAIDVSVMGGGKTITVSSSGGRYEPTSAIESSNDGASWAPVTTFQGPGVRTLSVACKFMRQTVSSFVDGVVPSVGVGSDDAGTAVAALAVPAGNGRGVALVASAFQTFKSVQVGGAFRGVLNIEVSDDGGATYSVLFSFSAPGVQSSSFAADHIRVARAGVPTVGAGLPSVVIGDSSSGGGGGGGGGSAGGPLLNIPTETFINLIGVNNNVDLWSGGPHTTRVEVDLVGGSGATITGIAAGTEGDILLLWNGGGGANPDTLTIVNQSALSAPANRIWVADGKNINIANNNGVLLVYVGDSWTTFAGETTMVRAQELSLDPATQPAALANGSTTNDYNPWSTPPFTSYVRQDTGLASTLTGIVAAGAPNSEGRIVAFTNISTTGTITILHNSAGSSPVNRILCPNAANIALLPLCTMTLIYDLNVGIWRVLAVTGPASSGKQVFRYLANGTETDTVVVALPAARGSTSYNVQGTMGKNATGIAIEGIDPATFLVGQFTVKLTAAPTLNDSIMFTVEDLT